MSGNLTSDRAPLSPKVRRLAAFGRQPAPGDALGGRLFEEVRAAKEAAMLIDEPLRKRMADSLRWTPEKPKPLQCVVELFVNGVVQVRNNLVLARIKAGWRIGSSSRMGSQVRASKMLRSPGIF
jgi:hypothetical protein